MLPNKSTLEIFRDCLKVIPRMVQEEKKIISVRELLKKEFLKNKKERGLLKIFILKMKIKYNYLEIMPSEELVII
jgi:hypothetical protein